MENIEMYQIIQNKPLDPEKKYSNLFLARGVHTFHEACEYVWCLPYGRISPSNNLDNVIQKQKGTCSTKHALLKLLADELDIQVILTLGIYEMSESNTKGVGCVLKKYSLDSIPEAHCYLKYLNRRIDLTRKDAESEEGIDKFLVEISIIPSDLQSRKQEIHRNFIKENCHEHSLDVLWTIREECIAALCT